MKKRKFLFAFLSLLTAVSLCLCLNLFNGIAEVNAETSDFQMVNGASVRLTDSSGIKFTAKIGTSYDAVNKYYMMIIPEDYITTYNLSGENFNGDYYNTLKSALTAANVSTFIANMKCEPYSDGGIYYIRGSLTNLRYDNINREFFGIAYYIDSSGNYIYADFISGENVRDIAHISYAALISGDYNEYSDILKDYIKQGINKSYGVAEENRHSDVSTAFLSVNLDNFVTGVYSQFNTTCGTVSKYTGEIGNKNETFLTYTDNNNNNEAFTSASGKVSVELLAAMKALGYTKVSVQIYCDSSQDVFISNQGVATSGISVNPMQINGKGWVTYSWDINWLINQYYSGTIKMDDTPLVCITGNPDAVIYFSDFRFDVDVTGIEAIYNQGEKVFYESSDINGVKDGLAVKLNYSDGKSTTAAAENYTLSGKLEVGKSTITVTYGKFTDTVSVTVSAFSTTFLSNSTDNFATGVYGLWGKMSGSLSSYTGEIGGKSGTFLVYTDNNEGREAFTSANGAVNLETMKAMKALGFTRISVQIYTSSTQDVSICNHGITTGGNVLNEVALKGQGWLTYNWNIDWLISQYSAGNICMEITPLVCVFGDPNQPLYFSNFYYDADKELTGIYAEFNQNDLVIYPISDINSLKNNLKVYLTYKLHGNEVLSASDYTLSGTLAVGTSIITVKYGKYTYTVEVTVTEAPVETGIKATYNQGGKVFYESSDINGVKDGLAVKLNYSDGKFTAVAAENYTVSGTLAVGESTVTVTYGKFTDTVSVTVSAFSTTFLSNSTDNFATGVYGLWGKMSGSLSSYTGEIGGKNGTYLAYTDNNEGREAFTSANGAVNLEAMKAMKALGYTKISVQIYTSSTQDVSICNYGGSTGGNVLNEVALKGQGWLTYNWDIDWLISQYSSGNISMAVTPLVCVFGDPNQPLYFSNFTYAK